MVVLTTTVFQPPPVWQSSDRPPLRPVNFHLNIKVGISLEVSPPSLPSLLVMNNSRENLLQVRSNSKVKQQDRRLNFS